MHTHAPVRRPRIRRSAASSLIVTALVVTALTAATATACSNGVVTVTTGSSTRDAADLTVDDAWVKAAPAGMTGAFATLTNDGGDDVRLTSVTTDIARTVELHETVSDGAGGMTMRPREGGFTIRAGARHELAPGGDHIMLMGLTGPLAPGQEVRLVLHLSDGSTRTATALVKDFTGAEEKYAGSGTGPTGMSGMSGMTGTEPGSDG